MKDSSLREKDDKELSKLASEHNKEAFSALIERYEEYMMAVSHRYTDTYHEAQDIFQKGCLKAWNAFPRFRMDCHFKTWVYQVVRSAAYDHNSWKKRKAEVSFEHILGRGVGDTNSSDTEIKKTMPRSREGVYGSLSAKAWGKTLFEMVLDESRQPDRALEISDNNKELFDKLDEVMGKLTPTHRQCLESSAQGMTYEEIAKIQKVSVGTVMSRLFYARKKARRLCNNIRNYNRSV